MCGLAPGDEVICLRVHPEDPNIVEVGQHYHVAEVQPPWECLPDGSFLADWAIQLTEVPRVDDYENWGFYAASFRKVERRNDRLTIEAFSVIKDGGFEEPRRPTTPAKKRERA